MLIFRNIGGYNPRNYTQQEYNFYIEQQHPKQGYATQKSDEKGPKVALGDHENVIAQMKEWLKTKYNAGDFDKKFKAVFSVDNQWTSVYLDEIVRKFNVNKDAVQAKWELFIQSNQPNDSQGPTYYAVRDKSLQYLREAWCNLTQDSQDYPAYLGDNFILLPEHRNYFYNCNGIDSAIVQAHIDNLNAVLSLNLEQLLQLGKDIQVSDIYERSQIQTENNAEEINALRNQITVLETEKSELMKGTDMCKQNLERKVLEIGQEKFELNREKTELSDRCVELTNKLQEQGLQIKKLEDKLYFVQNQPEVQNQHLESDFLLTPLLRNGWFQAALLVAVIASACALVLLNIAAIAGGIGGAAVVLLGACLYDRCFREGASSTGVSFS